MADEIDPKVAEEVGNALMRAAWSVFETHQKVSTERPEVSHIAYSRVAMVSFGHMSAVLAVDTHISKELFVKLMSERWDDAFSGAAKFG